MKKTNNIIEKHEDCCGSCDKTKEMKGGNANMDRRTLLWIAVGILFIIALFLAFKTGNAGTAVSAKAVASAAQSSAPAMIGGC